MKINHFPLIAIVFGIASLLSVPASAGDPDVSKSIFDVMNYQEVLDITIEVDLDSIRAGRRSDQEFETILSFQDEDGAWQAWPIDLALRGRFRRSKCDVPPLKVDIKKSLLKERGLAPFDDFDLVTQCVVDKELAKELLLKEYLAYRLFNELSEYSYRAQMVRVTYRNPTTGTEEQQWGIIIEDTAQLEARIGAEKIDSLGLEASALHQEQLKRVAVFQNMIGNADWSIPTGRNIKFFRKGDQLIPIPYDFDFSGLVDAPYARALTNNESILRLLKPDLFFGELPLDLDFKPTLEYFESKRSDLLARVRKLKSLPSGTRRELKKYLKVFFENYVAIYGGDQAGI